MKSIRTTLIMCMLLPIALAFAMLGGTLIVYMNNISVSDGNENMPAAAAQTAESVDGVLNLIQARVDLLANANNILPDEAKIQAKDMTYFKGYEKEMNEVVVSSTKDINGLVASYIRYDPSLTYGTSGTFYTDADGDGKLEEVTPTDLSVYDKTIRNTWAGSILRLRIRRQPGWSLISMPISIRRLFPMFLRSI